MSGQRRSAGARRRRRGGVGAAGFLVASIALAAPAMAQAQRSDGVLPGEPARPGAVRDDASGVTERDMVEIDPAQAITVLDIDNRLGNLRVEGHDSEKLMISAFKRARDQDTLDRLKVTLVPDPSGPVRISTAISTGPEARPIPAGSVKIDLVILAPRSARVDARLWNGRLEIIGMENGAELSANHGDIDVKNASGTIATHLGAGRQHFVEIFGAVDAQSIEGRVELDLVRGQRLDASVHEGSIDGRSVRVREAWLRATRGDISFHGHAMAGGRYRIATYRGNVAVKLGHGGPVSVRVRAPQGKAMMPAGLETRTDARGMLLAMVPGAREAMAVVELRAASGTIRFAVIE